MKKKKKMPLSQLTLIVTVVFMVVLFLANMLVFNLAEYIEFFKNIHETFGKFVIISEIILTIVLVFCIGLFRFNGYQFTVNIPLEKASEEFNEKYNIIHSKYDDELKSIKGNLGILEIFTWFSYLLAMAVFPVGGILIPSLTLDNVALEFSILAALGSFLLLPFIALNFRNGKKRDYVEYFKDNCIKEFLQQFNYEYSRIAPFGIGDKVREVFNIARCDKSGAMTANVDDYIVKNIGDEKIELTETCFCNTFNGDKLVIFDGIFGYLKLNKNFDFRLRIKNVELYECNDLEKLELKEDKFTRYFSVYSDNSKSALEILTNELAQLLIEMYEKYEIQFEININKDLLAIKFYTGRMFEPTIVGKTLDKNVFLAYYVITEFATELMNKTKEYIDKI